MLYKFDFSFLLEKWPVFLTGAWLTIQLTVLSIGLGFVVGTLCAIARVYGGRNLRLLVGFYVELIRNTPLLVQLYLFYFVLAPILGLERGMTAVLCLGLFEGAFAAAKSAGRPTDVYGISLGVADKVAKCGIKNNKNWLAATAISPEKYGWVGIPYMIQAIKTGKKPNKLLYVPLVAVNSANIGKYYPNLGC